MRYTAKALQSDLEIINADLKNSSNFYQIEYQNRNGYHSIDLIGVNENGERVTLRNIDCNETPRALLNRAENEAEYYKNENYRG